MSKKKSASSGRPELQFISSLPLEEAVKVLRALNSLKTPLILTEVDVDAWQFVMRHTDAPSKRPRVSVKGTLHRWNGTFTRVECSRETPPRSIFPVVAFGLTLFALSGCCLFLFGADIVSGVLVIVGLLMILVLIMAALSRSLRPVIEDSASEKLHQRLFLDIHRGFKLAGDVSRDEDDLYPDDDPGVEAVLNARETHQRRNK